MRTQPCCKKLANIVRPQLPNLDGVPPEVLLQQHAYDAKSPLARPRRQPSYIAQVFVVAMQLFDNVIRQCCRWPSA